MSDIKIEVVDASEELKKETKLAISLATDLQIKTQDDYDMAGTIGKTLKESVKKIKDYFAPIKKSTDEAHKKAVAMEKDFLKGPQAAINELKSLMLGFEREQERIRREKEEKLRKQLEEKAKAELDKQIELGIEEADAIAEAIIPDFSPEDIVVSSSFKASGSTRKNWKAQVVDFDKFLSAVIKEGRLELLEVNQKALNSYAKSLEAKAKLDGVRFYNDATKVF